MNTFRINKGMRRQWYAKVMVCKGNGMQRSSFASSSDLIPLKRVTSYFNSYLNWYAKNWYAKVLLCI